MSSIRLTKKQTELVELPLTSKVFLEGMAGAGKTTVGVRRVRHLLERGVPAHEILILVPQSGLALPYREETRHPKRKAGADVTVTTFGALARGMVDLFWTLIAAEFGFARADRRPVFLSNDLVQFVMSRVIEPEIQRNDYFNSVRLNRNRLYAQIADVLNKSALVGFEVNRIGEKLKSAWGGADEQRHIYDDAQACAALFRAACLQHNLLDFSLQAALFSEYLWAISDVRAHLTQRYRHLIVDNVEEDTPAAHYILQGWLREARSALVICDTDASYRSFLGADEVSARTLARHCDEQMTLNETRVMSAHMQMLLAGFNTVLKDAPAPSKRRRGEMRAALTFNTLNENRYHTQMIDWIARGVAGLVKMEPPVPPREIVILAPLLNDSLRFSLASRLEQLEVPTYSLRPSRPLRDEPAVRAMITWAKWAHPAWDLPLDHAISRQDFVHALLQSLADLDLLRASLLGEVGFNQRASFTQIQSAELRERITYTFGERYDALLAWLGAYSGQPEPIDLFFTRLFGEVLSQPGFGFHSNLDAGRAAASLVDSARRFRQVMGTVFPDVNLGREFVGLVDSGVIVDQYLPPELAQGEPDAVLIAPAYTFLLSNRAVGYQFWVDIDNVNWGRRLYQPLTHPYVLSLNWRDGRVWTDADEEETSAEMLFRIVTGLVKRCRHKIYVGFSQYNEQGGEQIGALRVTLDQMLRLTSPDLIGDENAS